MLKKFVFAVAVLAAASVAQAGQVNGTQALVDIGTTTTNTPDINSAAVINFGSLLTTGSHTGDFLTTAGTAGQSLGAAVLTIATPATFSFGNATLGGFVGSSLMTLPSNGNTISFYVLGTFTPGTLFPGFDAGPASVTIALTQNNPGDAISAALTLSTPPAPVTSTPEPATVATALMGAAAFAFARLRRKSA